MTYENDEGERDSITELLERYDAWAEQRQAIFDDEVRTGILDHDAIWASEDDACDLAHELAQALKDLT